MCLRSARHGTASMTLPRLKLSDGALVGLKWLGLLLMTGDHVSKYLFNGTVEWLYYLGRLAMPLFVFVLAYNLARPDALVRGAYQRTLWRLVVAGCVATPPFLALGGLGVSWWPLNIMFTLASIVFVLYLIELQTVASRIGAGLVLMLAGSLVEFWWPAIALGLAIWLYCRRPSLVYAGLALTALGALWPINGNLWAFAVVPVVVVASRVSWLVPRSRWFFYAYYPGHLALLWLIRIPMSRAGYLFF